MGKFSTYRYLELRDDSPPSSHSRSRGRSIRRPRKFMKVFIGLIILAICVTYILSLLSGQSKWLDGIAQSLGYESIHHHAVIIDAGSTGSRVLAYKFRIPFTVFGPTTLLLEKEYFEQSKPGLSAFADDPEKGAETIVRLIKKAEFLTPPEKRKDTPIIVRATAGLRLLPEVKAQQLIHHVAKDISQLGYNMTDGAVEIMEGSDEGIYIWYTVNLLNNVIESGDGETMVSLDLGGGSTQITYQLGEEDLESVPFEDQYWIPAGKNITLYTHSYLNLGLMAARYGVLRMEANNNTTHDFTSVCIEPIIQKEPWTYARKQYTVSGSPRPENMKREKVYAACHELVKKYVLHTMDWEPKNPPKGKVAAMSYFYDVAADAGIIDVMKGGVVSVAQYRASALRACSAANVEQPWACFDLVYIVTLLHDGYKIKDSEPISLFKKVNGFEVSWALGLAYTTAMKKIMAMKGAQ